MLRRILKSTNRAIREKELWTFDTEDNSKGVVKQIDLYDGTDHYHFRNRESFRRFLYDEINRPVVILAVNLEYDLLNTFGDALDLLSFRFKSGGLRIVSARLRGTRVTFYDTLNHATISADEMGSKLGLRKLDMDLSSWLYVERDAEIPYHYMTGLQAAYNRIGANLNATLPSSAMDLFRRHHLFAPVTQPSRQALAFMYRGYYGGRTEVFYRKPVDGPVWYIDVNSLYPSVMIGEYPNPNVYTVKQRRTGNAPAMIEATVETTRDTYFPVLPHRDGKLMFPAGRFRGVWPSVELDYFESTGGRILKVHRVMEFPATCFPFESYIESIYPLKAKESDPIRRDAWKMLLNSLYGKFGERIRPVEMIPVKKAPNDKPSIVHGGFAFVESPETFPSHTNVIWSAWTTALARIVLHRELVRIADAGGLVLYCDTDSVIYRAPQRLHNPSDQLGEWGEVDCTDFGHFLAPKFYSLGSGSKRRVRAKGVPRKYAPVFFDEWKATFRRPYRLRGVLARGLTGTYWDEFTKKFHGIYDKRRTLDSGHTAPIFYSRL